MSKSEGKLFEEDFQKSTLEGAEKVFFVRIKDAFIPAEFRAKIRVTKNDYDCLMFARSHLFTLELKSTKQKSVSFDEKIIKQHQIDKLLEAAKHKGVVSGFIINFREPKNRVFFIHINDFVKYKDIAQNGKESEYKNKVNKSSIPLGICEEIGIEIKGFKKKVKWHYHIGDFITEAINTYKL
ncbi:Holliday junction-specific endonuclease [compost metagenome]